MEKKKKKTVSIVVVYRSDETTNNNNSNYTNNKKKDQQEISSASLFDVVVVVHSKETNQHQIGSFQPVQTIPGFILSVCCNTIQESRRQFFLSFSLFCCLKRTESHCVSDDIIEPQWMRENDDDDDHWSAYIISPLYPDSIEFPLTVRNTTTTINRYLYNCPVPLKCLVTDYFTKKERKTSDKEFINVPQHLLAAASSGKSRMLQHFCLSLSHKQCDFYTVDSLLPAEFVCNLVITHQCVKWWTVSFHLPLSRAQ